MAERYIKEYANDCKRKIEENNLMGSNVKNKTMAKYTKRRDKRGYEWKSAYREKEALMLESY